jgi:SAM-dependent methyltransferase
MDFSHRAQLTELMDEPCSRDQLSACLRDIARTNRWTLTHRPTIRWLNEVILACSPLPTPFRILDVGSGYGDGLRKVEEWAKTRGIPVELTGLDLNPDAAAIALEASPASSRIRWVTANVFAYKPPRPVHLVVSSLFTHHLADNEVIAFLKWMELHATLGWFVNDLSRAPVPYHLFRAFAKLASLHPFVQYDGPVSIAKSFRPEEWRTMCAVAGLDESSIEIQSYKPARLCVSRRKPQ